MSHLHSHKKIVWIDMDGVLADFESHIKEHNIQNIDHTPNVFLHIQPMPGAVDAVKRLYDSNLYDLHIASAPAWNNVTSYTDKRIWIERHFGSIFKQKFTLTHTKNLLIGDILIDDRSKHGAGQFTGRWIHFGTERYPNWCSVCDELLPPIDTI